MSYLKRWRNYHAQVEALAQPGSSDEELGNHPTADRDENIARAISNQSDSPDDSHDTNNDSTSSISNLSSSDNDETTFSDSSDTLLEESDADEGNVPELGEELARWATKNKCTRSALNEMLDILRGQGHRLPKDSRTLLQTPRVVNHENKCGGQYLYFGIETGLLKVIAQHPPSFNDKIANLSFNIDGVPLFRSSNTQLWPILCSVNGIDPFIVALFYGNSKPKSVEDYLSDFLTECTHLIEDGVEYSGELFMVNVRAFICDAPARAFLKCTKGHNAYYSCERCTIKGKWNGRVVFNVEDEISPLRTEEKFNNFEYQSHQIKRSPLIEAGLSCIKSFPLDYMHLICLGVVKRMLTFLKQGPRECKLSHQQFTLISETLSVLNGKMPREFARQPRSLYELDKWKATEFRQFLLYTGPLVLRSVVSEKLYNHFLSLTVAVSILLNSNDNIRNSYLDYARQLLVFFVKEGKNIYGETFASYNVHALIHIADDVDNFKTSLNELSAFPYENHLHKLKKSVKKAQNPIAQITKRAIELEKSRLRNTPKSNSFFVSTLKKDSCFLTKNQQFAFVKEKRRNETFVCDVIDQRGLDNFFVTPCESRLIDIAVIRNMERHSKRKLLEHGDFARKVVVLQFDTGYLLLPMLHCLERR